MVYHSQLGGHIRSERTSAQLTLREVCQRSGISIQHLSDIERGTKGVKPATLVRIGKALGIKDSTIERWWADHQRDRLKEARHTVEKREIDRRQMRGEQNAKRRPQ